MNDIIVKVEELCYKIDMYLEEMKQNPYLIVPAIYDYLTLNNITVIYPNTYVQTYNEYVSFFDRLKNTIDNLVVSLEYRESILEKTEYILKYFRSILFDIDLSVIR